MLGSLEPQVTMITITHRPALADFADLVVQIEDGAEKAAEIAIARAQAEENGRMAQLSGTKRG